MFFTFVVDSDVIVVVNGSDEIDPLVVEQALLKCFKALWSAEFSVVWRLGDTNKWLFCLKSESIIMCKRWNSARNNWLLSFSCFKRVNFSYAGSLSNVCVLLLFLCLNSKEMIRKSFSLAYLCEMLFYACSSYKSWLNVQRRIIFFEFVILLSEVCYFFLV